MKHPRTRIVTVSSPYARSRGVRQNGRLKTVHVPPLPPHPGELLSRQVQSAVEEERRRIARELHDEFGQALTGLKFDLAWCGSTLTPALPSSAIAELAHKVQTMSRAVDALLGAVRETAAELRPAMLDDLGLVPALKCLGAKFQQRTAARCTIDVAPAVEAIALPADVSAALYRITQELLTNVTRHAVASQVHIRLSLHEGQVTLAVTDNGKGITPERVATRHSCGIRGMQERAALLGGHFSIVGRPGGGTTACASVPVTERIAS